MNTLYINIAKSLVNLNYRVKCSGGNIFLASCMWQVRCTSAPSTTAASPATGRSGSLYWWVDGYGWMDGWMDVWMDGYKLMNGWMGWWLVGWTHAAPLQNTLTPEKFLNLLIGQYFPNILYIYRWKIDRCTSATLYVILYMYIQAIFYKRALMTVHVGKRGCDVTSGEYQAGSTPGDYLPDIYKQISPSKAKGKRKQLMHVWIHRGESKKKHFDQEKRKENMSKRCLIWKKGEKMNRLMMK